MKTSAIITALTLILTATGVTGYKIVKTKNYGGVEENLHKVTKVIDGDSFKIKGPEDEDIMVRILSISAPENDECYFNESKQALKELIDKKEVRLEKDISGTDRYGRLLRHVILPSRTDEDDNVLVGKYMVLNGFAKNVASSPDLIYKSVLERAEGDAVNKDAGVWGNCEILPKDFSDTEITDAKPTNEKCLIKGNISEKGRGDKIYFLPECQQYSQVKINLNLGEQYFCTEKEAKKAGFERYVYCDK
ncbi:thermonuclease family protein [Patescibacteria group bacterium]